MSSTAPTIAADVAVTITDNVARELLSLGGVVEAPVLLVATRRHTNDRPAGCPGWCAAGYRSR
jgi:hypothetical protein